MTKPGQITFQDRACTFGCDEVTSHKVTEHLSSDGKRWLTDIACLTPERHILGHGANLDNREADLADRESRCDASEAALAAHGAVARQVLTEAKRRDAVADDRDISANDREEAESLTAFLNAKSDIPDPTTRRASALDRNFAKEDRSASAADRDKLAADAMEFSNYSNATDSSTSR